MDKIRHRVNITVSTKSTDGMVARMIETSGIPKDQWSILRPESMGLAESGEHADFQTCGFNTLVNKRSLHVCDALIAGLDVLMVDADVVFFEPFSKFQIDDDAEIFAQHDPDTGVCMGFALMRATERIKLFARNWRHNLSRNDVNDQVIANAIIRCIKPEHRLRIQYAETVQSYGLIANGIWSGQEFNLPADTQAFHANYAVGINDKLRLLNYVERLAK